MTKAVDCSGMVFGRLTVVRLSHVRVLPSGQRKPYWLCKCECGTERIASIASLKRGDTASCGCLRRDMVAAKNLTHGMSKSPENGVWLDMKKRCTNPNYKQFADYGGRGIKVCERWMNSFEAFFEDMGQRPSPKHSMERIANEGNYEPGNVKWATDAEQKNNMRKSRHITIDGDTRTIAQWARLYKMNVYTLYQRFDAGWEPKRAVTEPPRKWPSQR